MKPITSPFETGEFKTTPTFRDIKSHTAIFYKEDGQLVAVTGPAGDEVSENYAALFAQAPVMKTALEIILYQAFLLIVEDPRASIETIANVCRSILGDDYKPNMEWLEQMADKTK